MNGDEREKEVSLWDECLARIANMQVQLRDMQKVIAVAKKLYKDGRPVVLQISPIAVNPYVGGVDIRKIEEYPWASNEPTEVLLQNEVSKRGETIHLLEKENERLRAQLTRALDSSPFMHLSDCKGAQLEQLASGTRICMGCEAVRKKGVE